MRKYFILVFFCIVCGCSFSKDSNYIPPKHVVLAGKILKEMEKKLSAQYHMRAISDTVGLIENVNLLGLGFQIRGPLTQDQLRVILVDCVEEFLAAINNNDEIRPFLKLYPYTSEGIQISLFVIDPQGRSLYDPNIGVATVRRGVITYLITDKAKPLIYKSEVRETYEEAQNIVYNDHNLSCKNS